MTVLRFAVATVFILAAVGKLGSPAQFTAFLANSGLPVSTLKAGLLGIAGAELCIAALLLVPGFERAGSGAAAIASCLFLLVQIRSWMTARAACSCFGRIDDDQPPLVGTIRAGAVAASSVVLLLFSGLESPTLLEGIVGVLLGVTAIQAFAMVSGLLRIGAYRRKLRTELNWAPGKSGNTLERTQQA